MFPLSTTQLHLLAARAPNRPVYDDGWEPQVQRLALATSRNPGAVHKVLVAPAVPARRIGRRRGTAHTRSRRGTGLRRS